MVSKKTSEMSFSEIQKLMIVKKDVKNTFGNYNYRQAEGIITTFKNIVKGSWVIRINDTVEVIGDRYYVRSDVNVYNESTKETFSSFAYAREHETQSKMHPPQITGSCSSYARKYALCGLFGIGDGSEDPDTKPTPEQENSKEMSDIFKIFKPLAINKDQDYVFYCKSFFGGQVKPISNMGYYDLKSFHNGWVDYLQNKEL